MVRVGLFFLDENATAVVSVLGRLGVCQVDRAPTELKDYFTPRFPAEFREAYRRLADRYEPLAQRWRLTGQTHLEGTERRVPSVAEMNRLAETLAELRDRAQALDREFKRWRQRLSDLTHLEHYVRALTRLGIDVAGLANLRFLHLRAGTVPAENLERLRESAELGEDLVLSLGAQEDRAHILVIGAGDISADLEGLLAKAHFAPIELPAGGAARTGREILDDSHCEAESARLQLAELESRDAALREAAAAPLRETARLLAHAAVFVECDGAMEGRTPVAFLSGWAPRERVPQLRDSLGREVAGPVVLVYEGFTPDPGGAQPPSDMAVPAVFRPGASLVSLYGQPGYDEINPTALVAATAPLFFGMMFGDVGQGLLLGVLALAFRRRLGHWIAPALACSLGCTVFGVLYGSIFGVEHWLPALWLRPMNEPFRLLGVAIRIGIAFLMLTFLLKTVNLMRQGHWREAMLGFQGMGGAAIYTGGVLAVRALFLDQAMPPEAPVALIGGALMVAAFGALQFRRHGRAALADLATEFSHGTLSLLTNTLSFLRLAAFALNHAALSIALFLLVDLIPATPAGWVGRAVALAAGSAFILVLDALVVAVQTIRLEFYEGLTRFYRGDGELYRPLRFPDTESA